MSRVARNIIYNVAGQGLLLVLGLVAVRFIFRQLGSDALGIIYASVTVSAVLSGVFELGISTTIVREVSANLESDRHYVRDLIRTTALVYWLIYLVVAVVTVLGAPIFVRGWIHLQTMDSATATQVLRVMAVSAMLILPRVLYISVLRGMQRMVFNNVIDVTVSALQQFGTILILARGGSLFHVAYWFAACYAAGIVTYMVVIGWLFSWKVLIPGYSPTVVSRNLGFSSHMMSISLLGVVHTQADKVFVSKLQPLGTFGFYAFAAGMVARATLVTAAVAQAALPSLSSLAAHGDRPTSLIQYRKLHDLLCFTTVPIFAAIAFTALPVFGYVFGPATAQTLLLPTALLCIGWYMNGTLNVPYVFSISVGRPQISSRSNFLALFTVLPVTGLLVYTLGLVGAGLSWVVYQLWAYGYAVRRICRECLGIPPASWYGHVARIGGLTGLTYGAAFAVSYLFLGHALWSLIIGYALASVGFLGGAIALMGEDLRSAVRRLLSFQRVKAPGVAPIN